MELQEVATNLDNLLHTSDFKDFCQNGLLVDSTGNPNHKITKIVTGVSLRSSLIDEAIKRKAQAIIVHHPNGFWNSDRDRRIVGESGKYVRKLIRAGIDLFGYHLPLDAHSVVGNNAIIAQKLLGLKGTRLIPFMDGVGRIGSGSITKELLDKAFPKGWKCLGAPIGRVKHNLVAVCSGSGTSGLEEAVNRGVDVFVTGEVHESTTIFAEEHGISVVVAGHHRTEVFGVAALAEYINKPKNTYFDGVEAEFVDIDNPI